MWLKTILSTSSTRTWNIILTRSSRNDWRDSSNWTIAFRTSWQCTCFGPDIFRAVLLWSNLYLYQKLFCNDSANWRIGSKSSAANFVAFLRGVTLVEHHRVLSGKESQIEADHYPFRLNEVIVITGKSINEVLLTIGERKNMSLCPLVNVSICEIRLELQVQAHMHLFFFKNSFLWVSVEIRSKCIPEALSRTSKQKSFITRKQCNAKVQACPITVINNWKGVSPLPSHPRRHEVVLYKLKLNS